MNVSHKNLLHLLHPLRTAHDRVLVAYHQDINCYYNKDAYKELKALKDLLNSMEEI
jgi:hypothetical protein